MSSKTVDPSRRASWHRSLTVRLTLFYTLTTLLILSLAVGVLYWALAGDLGRDDNQFLLTKVYVLRRILSTPSRNADALREEVDWEGGSATHKRYYVRVLDSAGHTVRATPTLDALGIPDRAFPVPVPAAQTPQRAKRYCASDTRCYLLLSAWAATDRAPYRMQLILDVSSEERLLSDYRRMLMLVLLAGTFVAAGIGIVATRRGMRPLQDVTRAARNIDPLRLSQRIGPARWPAELANLAEAFDAMLERLEIGFNRISHFSTDLAHELRTPINNLMGELEVALSKPRRESEYRQALESGLEECARLATMIDRLLFLSRTTEAAPRIEKTRLAGRAEAQAVCEYFEALAEEKGVALRCEGEAEIRADAVLLRRALGNLVSNALQYTPAGGGVTVTLAATADGGAVLRVADTGIGIAPDEIARLFDRFYRSDAARALYPQGTGLGLAIVQSIMTLHGGGVDLEPAPGGGTLATLTFPAPR